MGPRGRVCEPRAVRGENQGNYLVEVVEDLQGQLKNVLTGRPVNDEAAAQVKKLSAAANEAKETGEEVQEACDGEARAPVSESSESCQSGFDRLWGSYVALETALAPLIAPLDE